LCTWKVRLIGAAAAGGDGSHCHRAADVELVQREEEESLALAIPFVACNIASDDIVIATEVGGLLLALVGSEGSSREPRGSAAGIRGGLIDIEKMAGSEFGYGALERYGALGRLARSKDIAKERYGAKER